MWQTTLYMAMVLVYPISKLYDTLEWGGASKVRYKSAGNDGGANGNVDSVANNSPVGTGGVVTVQSGIPVRTSLLTWCFFRDDLSFVFIVLAALNDFIQDKFTYKFVSGLLKCDYSRHLCVSDPANRDNVRWFLLAGWSMAFVIPSLMSSLSSAREKYGED